MQDEEKVTYFGLTDARNKRVRFGIKAKDRARHVYSIGKTGMGKSTLLENLAVQDIQNGEGLAFIDPHGKSADLLLEYIPEHRKKDVVYFAPFDLDFPIAFNALEDVGVTKRYLVANGLMSAFKTIWVDAFSARMEYILNNIMLALLEYPGSTLMSVNRMLTDKDFRNTVVANVTDPTVKAFWIDEYGKYTEKFAAEAAPAIQNKVGQFVGNPLVRNIIGQPVSGFDIRDIMDNKKILIINLSKGRVGEANANLLGAMLITKIYLAAMSRADLKEEELKNTPQFYLYVDEFQSFANETFADILSEARKYKLSLTIAHQYVEQMTEDVRAAVFGNVGTMITFRVGAYDAAVFEKEYAPEFTAEDLVNLQQYQMYLKLMIDGVTSRPFSAVGMPPIAKPDVSYVDEIINLSREQFANPREKVEEDIRNWHVQKIGAKESSTASKGVSDRPRRADNSDRPSNSGQDRRSTPARSNEVERADRRGSDTDRRAGSRTDYSPDRRDARPSERPPERSSSEPSSESLPVQSSSHSTRQSPRPPARSPARHLEEKKEVINNLDSDTSVNVSNHKVSNHVSLNALTNNGNGSSGNSGNNANKIKNNHKAIDPENASALRNALLSVMGDNTNADIDKSADNHSDDKLTQDNSGGVIKDSTQKLVDEESKVITKDEKKNTEKTSESGKKDGSLSPDDLKRILDINE